MQTVCRRTTAVLLLDTCAQTLSSTAAGMASMKCALLCSDAADRTGICRVCCTPISPAAGVTAHTHPAQTNTAHGHGMWQCSTSAEQ
jgi:hypothetical protein